MEFRKGIENQEEFMNHVIWLIKKRRQELDISQLMLSKLTGIDQAFLSRIEKGEKRDISVWNLYRIMSCLEGTIKVEYKEILDDSI